MENDRVLVHLASGIGNVILATPLLVALSEMEFEIDVLLHADYQETGDLLRDWQIIHTVINGHKEPVPNFASYRYILPAIPPFYWSRFRYFFGARKNILPRPDDSLFYQNEQEYYLYFATQLGYPDNRHPHYHLPIIPVLNLEHESSNILIAPGSKTGEMAKKRWPFFPELAERFENVIIVGTNDDLYDCRGHNFVFPSTATSLVENLNLKETAEIMASGAVVIGNDAGLSHLAAATGVATVMIFGPTPHLCLGPIPRNVFVLRAGLGCEPCWFRERFHGCGGQINCLHQLTVDVVEHTVRTIIN
jgi:ADP-heptose:LPS heptosyltransferase